MNASSLTMSSSLRAVPGNVGSDERRRATLHGAGMRHSALLTQRVVGFRNMIGVYFELVDLYVPRCHRYFPRSFNNIIGTEIYHFVDELRPR